MVSVLLAYNYNKYILQKEKSEVAQIISAFFLGYYSLQYFIL